MKSSRTLSPAAISRMTSRLSEAFPEKSSDIVLLSADPELIKALRNRLECFFEIVPGPSDRKLLQTAKQIGIAPVATNAVHFAAEDGYPLHRLVRAIALNKTLGSLAPEDTATPGRWLKISPRDVRTFPQLPGSACQLGKNRTVLPYRLGPFSDRFPSLPR